GRSTRIDPTPSSNSLSRSSPATRLPPSTARAPSPPFPFAAANCSTADSTVPTIPSASQAHPQVRTDLVNLYGPFTLAAGDEPRRNRLVNTPPSALTPAKGLSTSFVT